MKTTKYKQKAGLLNSVANGRRSIKAVLREKWVVVMSDMETGTSYIDDTATFPPKRIELPADEAGQEKYLAKLYPHYKVVIVMRIGWPTEKGKPQR